MEYAICELWEIHPKFEIAKNVSYMHSKLCEHPVSKKELANSNFNPVKKNTQTVSNENQ